MDYETFEKAVSDRLGAPRDRGRVLIRATLQTLADRLTLGETDDLAAQLPEQLKEWLSKSGDSAAEPFGLDEFIRRVSERAQAPPDEARKAARAVFMTLRDAVTAGEFKDVMSQLPDEFSELTGS
jgi:uncharacterized protein (DUF2267 family)